MSSLRKEQLKQAREALLKQIESWKGDQEGAREQINSLSDEELESFLIKNKIIKLPYGESENSAESKSPFRMIVEGKIKSYKISENDSALAVLEINPVSKGHTIIIQKSPSEEILEGTETLVKETADKLKYTLNCRRVDVAVQDVLGERIINLIPVHNEENINSERKKASDNELKDVQKQILEKKAEEKTEKKSEKEIPIEKLPKAPRRIP
ncbi:hypothetical protein J4463_01155 [Candidatus Pacearchaeota archaeon]|nr:hypothetical protein [Candidatus Pacearchaeota archaeon]